MAFRPAISSPACSVRGRGYAQDRFGNKRRRTSALEPSAFEEEGLNATLEPTRRCDLVLEARVWGMLPEDVLDVILASLPFAAQRRFRCVSRRWKNVLCLPPPCMIVSRVAYSNDKIYCESEKMWFNLPSIMDPSVGCTWTVVDVEAGLVCYQSNVGGRFWLCVSNPLDSSLAQVIAPEYPRCHPPLRISSPPDVKLLVDRASKTYRIISFLDNQYTTAVYESTSSVWHVFDSSPLFWSRDMFVWENVVYVYNTKPRRKPRATERLVSAFSMESGKWVDIEVKVPSESNYPKKKYFLSGSNQVKLILSWYQNRLPYFSVWKLDKCSPDNSFSKWEKWEKVFIGSVRAVADLTGYRFAHASYGAECIWFTFCDGKVKEGGSKTHKCMSYSFSSNSWSVVPCPRDGGKSFKFYNWEPSMDLDPSFVQRNKAEDKVENELPTTDI